MSTTQEQKIDVSQLVMDHSDDMVRYAQSKLNNIEVAKDLVQDTFIVAVQKIDSFRGDSAPKTWLFSILKNKIMDHYRKKAKEKISDKNMDDGSDSFNDKDHWMENKGAALFEDESHLLDDPAFVKVFADCIDNLPEMWSSVIKMKYIDPIKSKEICKELDITDTNLWQIVHRSKLKLKDCLKINWLEPNS